MEGVPTEFPPSGHSHTAGDITDLAEWVKQPEKPTYTADEVGALAADGTAVRATADAVGNNIPDTYATKVQVDGLSGDVTEVKGEVGELKSDLVDFKNDVYSLDEITISEVYNCSELTTISGYAPNSGTTYLLRDKLIKGGCLLKCEVIKKGDNLPITFHLFEETPASGLLYLESKTGDKITFDLTNYPNDKNYVVGFTGILGYTLDEGDNPMFQCDTSNFVNGNYYAFAQVAQKAGFYANVTTYSKHETSNNNSMIVVSKKGNGNFTTINDALNYAYTIESRDNPVTIFIDSGVYNEVCRVGGGHYVSLIGLNRNDCIIRDDSGIYHNCPLRIEGNSYVANLTLISTHKNKSDFVTNGIINYLPSYGIHIDDRHANDDDDYKITVENCYIYSEQNPAVGIGLDKNQIVEFINCEMVSNISDDVLNATGSFEGNWAWKPNGGALFYHALYSGNYTNDNGYQKLVVKDCIIRNNAPNVAFGEGGGMEEQVTLEFINNVGYSTNNGTSFVKGLAGATISPFSYGNNCDGMNYTT